MSDDYKGGGEMMEQEISAKLFLELSQWVDAKTKRELELGLEVNRLREENTRLKEAIKHAIKYAKAIKIGIPDRNNAINLEADQIINILQKALEE